MKIISLLISLFGIIKTKALECMSVVNQKCMPRPKVLDVNEGIGEALFYPYNVQVNKCSGSCNTLVPSYHPQHIHNGKAKMKILVEKKHY